MTPPKHLLPKPLGDLLARLPAYPGSRLLVSGLNLTLAAQLPADVQPLLQGKTLRLCVTDTHWTFDFTWQGNRFVASHHTGPADLTISASVADFVRLARRQEDPDTLFFSRRLGLEGDTELGLLVKNTMDAIELPWLTPQAFTPSRLLAHLKARFTAV